MAKINGKDIVFSPNVHIGGSAADTFYANDSDYAVCFEWSDGNPSKENRLNRFVQLTDGGNKISFANSTADICGVTTDTAGFVENYGVYSEYTSFVGILGIVTVIDNGSCTVGDCCMSDDNGYAVPSSNNMGYRVMARVSANKIKVAVKPNDDMIQRIRTDITELDLEVNQLNGTVDGMGRQVGANSTAISDINGEVSELKEDLGELVTIKKSPNLLNQQDANITPKAQVASNGSVVTHDSWDSVVTDFINIDLNGSNILRSTIELNMYVAEYTTDGNFIAKTLINNTSPITLNDDTYKIRVQFWRNKELMIYQSDVVLPYEDYYAKKIINDNIVPDNIMRKEDIVPIEQEIIATNERISSIESFEITNYALYVETFIGKYYSNEGKLANNNQWAATSIVPLVKTKPVLTNAVNGHIVFFDKDKNYISIKSCYSDSSVSVSSYPDNAEYVAFDYFITNKEWGTYQKGVVGNSAPNRIFSQTKKKKGERPQINIYTTDSQLDILSKLCDAYHTEDCDVFFEHGEYFFDEIFIEMYNNGQRNYIELPIGGNNRYYFNGSKLVANQDSFNNAGLSGTISLLSCIYTNGKSESYELHDGILVGNGVTYIVHDECGGKPVFYTHKYNNMHFIYNSNGFDNWIRKPIGGGTGLFGAVQFENCIFETDYQYDLSFHGIDTTREETAYFNLSLLNCYLSNACSLDNLAQNQTADFLITGCTGKNISKTGTTNKWNVKSWCNEIHE